MGDSSEEEEPSESTGEPMPPLKGSTGKSTGKVTGKRKSTSSKASKASNQSSARKRMASNLKKMAQGKAPAPAPTKGTGHRKRKDFDPQIHVGPEVMKANDLIKAGGKRGPNFIDADDKVLCKAFMSVSEDPIKGADRRKDEFWEEISQKFNSLLVDEANAEDLVLLRDATNCRNRFMKLILPGMNKFMKHYRAAYEPLKSGWTEDMYIQRACELYEEQHGHAFKFTHCVTTLKQMPRFDPQVKETEVEDLEKGEVNDVGANAMGAGMSKPKGTKVSKLAAKLERYKERAKQTKNSNISELVQANKQLAASIERGRDIESLVSMARMYKDLGMRDAALKCMDEAQEVRKRASTPVSTHRSVPSQVMVTAGDGSPEEGHGGMKTTGLSDEEDEDDDEEESVEKGKSKGEVEVQSFSSESEKEYRGRPRSEKVEPLIGPCEGADSVCGNVHLERYRHHCWRCNKWVHNIQPCSFLCSKDDYGSEGEDKVLCINCAQRDDKRREEGKPLYLGTYD
jgi:hypothetical protein